MDRLTIQCKRQLKSHLESKFVVVLEVGLNLDGLQFKSILVVENDLLSRTFTAQKILEVVSKCGSTKSSGPDRYTFHFIKNNWDVLEADIVRAVSSFQSSGFIPLGYNAYVIMLVPWWL